MAELGQLGCKAVLVPGSVTDRCAVETALDRCTKTLRGVIQASMVLRDGAYPLMSFADWQECIAPKVEGTWNLHQALESRNADENVDFFLLLSSLSGLSGNPGRLIIVLQSLSMRRPARSPKRN